MKKQLPVLLGFFIMGFVDVVGISTNYARNDLHLREATANLLPFGVFIWFALFSVPTGLLMNRIGRRKTVIAGLVLTGIALLVPLTTYRFSTLLIAFAGIGIGNTILQVALNPLLVNVIPPQKLTSALSAGQLIKAIASFLGPIVAATASLRLGDWKLLFPAFAAVTALNTLWLWSTPIAEDPPAQTSSVSASLRLLKAPGILPLVFGVIAIVGIDVGLNTTLPHFLMTRCALPLEKAGLGASLYFIARTTGSLAGVILLTKLKPGRLYLATVILGLLSLTGLLLSPSLPLALGFIFLLGLAVANVFPILFATALRLAPARQNEVSGLLIMGVSGGAILLPVMGLLGDARGPAAALAFLLLAWGWLAMLHSRCAPR
jgi:fucose permease